MLLSTSLRIPNTMEAREALTITQKALSPLSAPQTLQAYTVDADDPNFIRVPKAWGLAAHREVEDAQGEGARVAPCASLNIGELRPHQKEAADIIEAALRSRPEGGGCLLQLPCGYGKTVCALEVARRMGHRTLIVVNTEVLASQWKAVIEEKVPGCSVGRIKQNTFDVEGRTHVIGSLKSLATRDYPWHGCGLCVVDECHHIAAVQMSQALERAGTRWRLGLSATPVRADGLSAFLEWSLGPVAYAMERERQRDLRVYAVELRGGSRTPARTITLRKGGKEVANSAGMINLFEGASPGARFRQQLAGAWVKLCLSKGRRLLVLSDRLSLLRDLGARAEAAEAKVGYVVGSAKTADREAALRDAQVICASYACAAEGMDCPTLDTLLLLTPRAGAACITQVVGRLLRAGGRDPLVIDFVDVETALFKGMFFKRRKLYADMGAKITRMDHMREQIKGAH